MIQIARRLPSLAVCLSLVVGSLPVLAKDAAQRSPVDKANWSILGGSSDVQHNSPLNQINDKTITGLGLAWWADIPSKDGLVGNPLVADGVVYQSGPMGNVYANDVRTGKQVWHFKAEPILEDSAMATYWSLQHNRGVAVQDDKVIVAVGDCRLIAIDRKTGVKAWEVAACDRKVLYGITAAPRVGGGMVFTGNNCIDSGTQRGYVDAYDGKTGARRWRFYTMPDDPSKPQADKVMEMAAKTWGKDWYSKTHGCASAWDSLTYDAKLNLLYIGTGGPAPFSPKDRGTDAGDELFSNSIVAVKADTGEYVWHYKTTPNDGWNFDSVMHMMVADLPIGGQLRRVVMTVPKNGFFYVLDAKTGKFISGDKLIPVNWASHIDKKTGRPVTLPDARYWERPNEKTIAVPGPYGAHNAWQAMAYNQKTGLVYVPMIYAPTLVEPDPLSKVGGVFFDMYYGSSGDPKWKSYGELVAWDPVKQKARWRVRQTTPINGGTLTTAGNVVFQGLADGHFNAYAADTGKLLWSYDAGSAPQAAPSTVEIDGQQLVIASVGNGASATPGKYAGRYGTTPQSRGQARLLAFKLGGTAQLPPRVKPVEFEKPSRPRPSAELAHTGERRYEAAFCVDCHGVRSDNGGGTVADLRRSSAQTHDLFAGIVLGGLRKEKGMPAFPELSMDDVNAIQAFLINESWDAYEAQEAAKARAAAATPKR